MIHDCHWLRFTCSGSELRKTSVYGCLVGAAGDASRRIEPVSVVPRISRGLLRKPKSDAATVVAVKGRESIPAPPRGTARGRQNEGRGVCDDHARTPSGDMHGVRVAVRKRPEVRTGPRSDMVCGEDRSAQRIPRGLCEEERNAQRSFLPQGI